MPYGRLKKYCREQNGDVATQVKDTTKATANANEKFRFYYHTDHLGSSSYITDISGEVYQHMEYFPFGETFIEERTDAEYTSYLYNGKELDEEAGLYYYGEGYYWLIDMRHFLSTGDMGEAIGLGVEVMQSTRDS